MKQLLSFIEVVVLVAILAVVCWHAGIKRLVAPRVQPATTEQWNHMSDVLEREAMPRAKGVRPGIANPVFVPTPAADRPAPIL